jgi:hypothetical protein
MLFCVYSLLRSFGHETLEYVIPDAGIRKTFSTSKEK